MREQITCALISVKNICATFARHLWTTPFLKEGPPFRLSSDTFPIQIWYFLKLQNVFVQIEQMYFLMDLIWRFSPAIRRDFEIKPKLGDSAAKIANLPNGAKSSSRFGPDNVQEQLREKTNTIVNLNQIQLEISTEMLVSVSANNSRRKGPKTVGPKGRPPPPFLAT